MKVSMAGGMMVSFESADVIGLNTAGTINGFLSSYTCCKLVPLILSLKWLGMKLEVRFLIRCRGAAPSLPNGLTLRLVICFSWVVVFLFKLSMAFNNFSCSLEEFDDVVVDDEHSELGGEVDGSLCWGI